jgi:hypothetical protein
VGGQKSICTASSDFCPPTAGHQETVGGGRPKSLRTSCAAPAYFWAADRNYRVPGHPLRARLHRAAFSHRVWSACSAHPNSAWVSQQTRNLAWELEKMLGPLRLGLKVRHQFPPAYTDRPQVFGST